MFVILQEKMPKDVIKILKEGVIGVLGRRRGRKTIGMEKIGRESGM